TYTAIVCSKLLTFRLGHCRQKQASTRRPAPSGHPQLEIRTVSKSERRAAVGCDRLQRKRQPCGFPQDPRRPQCSVLALGPFLHDIRSPRQHSGAASVEWIELRPHHICKPASCARERKLTLSV